MPGMGGIGQQPSFGGLESVRGAGITEAGKKQSGISKFMDKMKSFFSGTERAKQKKLSAELKAAQNAPPEKLDSKTEALKTEVQLIKDLYKGSPHDKPDIMAFQHIFRSHASESESEMRTKLNMLYPEWKTDSFVTDAFREFYGKP